MAPTPCEAVVLGSTSQRDAILLGKEATLVVLTGIKSQKDDYLAKASNGSLAYDFYKYALKIEYNRTKVWLGETNAINSHNQRLEQELKVDIAGRSNARKQLRTLRSGVGEAYLNLITVQYRTTGVRDLKVSADKSLWGVASGQSLNEYLRIVDMSPRQIISSEAERLLIGYQSKQKVTELSEWLSLKPMAQPGMWLSFKTTPEELSDTPMDVKFTVELTTNEGVVLTDTLDVKLVR